MIYDQSRYKARMVGFAVAGGILLVAGMAVSLPAEALPPAAPATGSNLVQDEAKAEALFKQALESQKNGDLQTARTYLNQSIALNPNSAITFYNRGIVNNSLGLEALAILDYDEAIRLDPKMAVAYNNRGNIRLNRGDYPEAFKDLSSATELSIGKEKAPSLANRCHTLVKLGQYTDAFNDANASVQFDPRYYGGYLCRGTIKVDRGLYSEAIADFNSAAQLDPSNHKIPAVRSIAKEHQRDYRGQLADAEKSIQIKPSGMGYRARGYAKLNLKNRNGAFADFQEAARRYKQEGGQAGYADVVQTMRKMQAGLR